MKNKLFLFALVIVLTISASLMVIAIGTYPAVDSSMVLYYHFNNNSAIGENDTYIIDSSNSIYKINATVSNATFNATDGILSDGAFMFNGVNSSIVLINQTFLSHNGTIAMWIYPTSLTSGDPFSANINVRFSLVYNSGETMGTSFGNPNVAFTSIKYPYVKKWNYIVLVYSLITTTTSNASLYINGAFMGSATFTGGGINSTAIRLGSFNNGGSGFFNGSIDEFVIYNTTLSEKEIWDNYILYLGCLSPSTNSIINGDVNFCGDSYHLNITNGYAINITKGDILFNCNNSMIYGSNDSSNTGIVIYSYSNINIRNCQIRDYGTGIRIDYGNNISIINSTFLGSLNVYSRGSNNTYIINSSFLRPDTSRAVIFQDSFNNYVYNSIFETNTTSNKISIELFSSHNNTIINNHFYNFTTHIFMNTSTLGKPSNNTIINNTFINAINAISSISGTTNTIIVENIIINLSQPFVNIHNSTIINISSNILTNSNLISAANNNNLSIYFNKINKSMSSFYIVGLTNNTNVNIFNNTIINPTKRIFTLSGDCTNLTIRNNYIYNESIIIGGTSNALISLDTCYGNNVTIAYNTLDSASYLLKVAKSTATTYIINNNFTNAYGSSDGYNNGIVLWHTSNVSIINNSITDVGCNGIMSTNSTNLLISNNIITMNITKSLVKNINCYYEPPTGISLSEIWITWTQDASESTNDNLTNKIYLYNNKNVIIFNNIISGFPVTLKDQGTVNLTSDILNYWFVSYQSPTYLVDVTNYYLSHDFENITTVHNITSDPGINYYDDLIGEGYMGSLTRIQMEFKIHKSYMYFRNVNQTNNLTSAIYNLTNALIYYSNGSVACINVNACDGNINITLTPNNASYALNDFNLTENVNRQFSPLWFSSSSSTTKKIASNLTNTINATVSVDTSPKLCSQLKQVSYSSHTGLYTNTYISSEYTCEGNQLTLTINGIEPATNSNILTLGYLGDSICDAWEDGFSIDCDVTSSPGGGNTGGPIINNTIIETAKESINKIENITKLTANQLLIILLISIIGFSLLYRYLDESRTNKRRKKINLQI